MTGLAFDPALPLPVIAGLAVLSLAAAAWALSRGLRGWPWRAAAGVVLACALAGPALDTAVRRGLGDIVLLLEDRSASQSLPGRTAQMETAADQLSRAITALPETELRRITVGDDPDGTRLGTALNRALAAEPEGRVAGIIALTDGRLHDPAALPADAPAPVHVLLTGQPSDWDRRLVIDEAPAFGLIDTRVTLRLRVEDQGAVPPSMQGRPATLRVSLDGADAQTIAVPPGMPLEIAVQPRHAGANVVALSLDPPPPPAPGEVPQLTDRNDAAAVTITGVRDRLRVLLVSGEPHPGERTWRNLLKSDAAVDLIHFTILRPPEKGDGVPVDEMALIAFPTRELFLERIDDFDLIIFDRYRERGILPPEYFDSIRDYVEKGGAILVSAGPELASVEGLGMTSLGDILPADATGRVIEQPFTPELTDIGRRHPVTAGLPGAPQSGSDAHWGRWLRMIETVPRPGAEVVMTAGGTPGPQPLLILQRAGEGRVALLASDQPWLWARGFEGGGPQLELLRRIAHWSMQEPELEEEALEADIAGGDSAGAGLLMRLTRRTLQEDVPPVIITAPDGTRSEVTLSPAGPGRFSADWPAPAPGLYRLAQGDLRRVIAVGPAAPREFEQTVADAGALGALAKASGGAVMQLSNGVPGLRLARPGRPAYGRGVGADWIALTPRGAETVGGRTQRPLLPPWGWLLLIAALMLAGWLREGRTARA
ncbi:hypothetical protein DRW48_12680 [Paracoccus suum]|uniref:Glutamine amidotransferase domain-containing protein n=1 Tax=Paracoccus suum TaxID=2259340 RepID=A0A344PM19_9RHOB|nr:glutamine amidotransferase [Paracoccus suum]AXC50424.1 hypothetical protein DRW48_12680 [Paracoccus suum]